MSCDHSPGQTSASMTHIEVEGVRVHNLKNIALRIPHGTLTVICGVSGSGKSSLAFDTLYAEGQRRYVATFSPYARQFLNQLERPDVDRIEGIPPAIAIRQQTRLSSPLSTVGTQTDLLTLLQRLFAQAGRPYCPQCNVPVQAWSAEAVAAEVIRSAANSPVIVAFEAATTGIAACASRDQFLQSGFTRCIHDGRVLRLEEVAWESLPTDTLIVVDRTTSKGDSARRIAEAARVAFEHDSPCHLFLRCATGNTQLDKARWQHELRFPAAVCPICRWAGRSVSQDSLSFHTAAGACPDCQGSGTEDKAEGIPCSKCHGTRLNEQARSVRLSAKSLPDILRLECDDVWSWLDDVQQSLSKNDARSLTTVLSQLRNRLTFLTETGLGYIALERPLTTLSGGEARRVVLCSAFGAGLSRALYVLDEPTSGMHATDIVRVICAARNLQEAGNTVVVVEHDLDFIRAADHVIELGPHGGRDGGKVVFEGLPEHLMDAGTATGTALADASGSANGGRSYCAISEFTRHKLWLRLRNVHCHNVCGANADIPLRTLCAVTGVSGSGKTSLIVDTLHPAATERIGGISRPSAGRCEELTGTQWIDDIRLLDQNPPIRSGRSIPATWLGIFDEVRKLLAATHEARKRSWTAGMFSFNSNSGGRCERCKGQGQVTIDMQFLPDVKTVCDNCQGKRFRADVLEVRYRDRNVNEILQMTADEAFSFFHNVRKVQRSLNALRQTGLGYMLIGQPISTLSGGEAQRIRIATLLAGVPDAEHEPPKRKKTNPSANTQGSLFILDEPSSGLHARDTDRLMSCLRQLVQVGHSVILIEHDAQLIEQCDYCVEMGPGAGRHGGRVVASGGISVRKRESRDEIDGASPSGPS